jgi:RNA polymerase sigma factor for flagellar operon FliA
MRDALIVEHVALVTQIAQRLSARLPPQVDIDDLVASGHVGLCDAAAAFDAARGVPFGAYARRRIVGAMLDYLRESDPLTRGDRARVKDGTLHHFEIQLHLDDAVHVRAHRLDEMASDAESQDVTLARLLQAQHVRGVVATLPERERFVIESYFWHHQSLADIGTALGVGESRASQLKTRACDRLRRVLAS